MLERSLAKERTPVDSASLAVFRITFGAIGTWEVGRYFRHGWISRYLEEPAFHFHYVGFGWVEPLPPPGMQILWAVLGLFMAMRGAGLLARFAGDRWVVLGATR